MTNSPEQPEPQSEVYVSFPIVGIGASAGGLAAFQAFFEALPEEPGMAFVLLQHLDPDAESMLVDLIQSHTDLPVQNIEDRLKIEPNHVYITPPGQEVEVRDRRFLMQGGRRGHGPRLPIDRFFRSLAADFGEASIGILLSGTGSDGTLGMKAIKEQGGMLAVQDPESAEFPGMPASAIEANNVDIVAPTAELADHLVEYVQVRWDPHVGTDSLRETLRGELSRIFRILEQASGHDFQGYKETTIIRRIEHRMAVRRLWRVEDYVQVLETDAEEQETLFRELLIGVTQFFRDMAAFDALEAEVFPNMLKNKGPGDMVRIWVTGCATGEEVYSVAMVLWEAKHNLDVESKVQIFATDIDEQALDFARHAVYPENIAADVPPAYLKRFFYRDEDSYVINKPIRDMVVFANQDLTRDPPFSRLDLITCRNLLIYLRPEMQKQLIPMFHYALRPGGYLFLGSAETLNEHDYLFETVKREWKIFRRLEAETPPLSTWGVHRVPRSRRRTTERKPSPTERTNPQRAAERFILSQYSPTTYVVINRRGEVLYFHNRTGRYLEPAAGAPTSDLIQMAREGLAMPLAAAIRKATRESRTAVYEDIRVETNGGVELVNLAIYPLDHNHGESDLFIVLFEQVRQTGRSADEDARVISEEEPQRRITELERELHMTRQYLQSTVSELEETNEELQSTNEELQSTNEELQSTNEELKTAKEELQSVNEELETVNNELQGRIDQLTRANNDLNNLLASIEVGIVFLDLDLKIKSFNRRAGHLLNLIGGDEGRPLRHLATNLEYDRLVEDAQRVLDTLAARDVEIRTNEGTWFAVLMRPYRTLDNVIDGVVMTFSEISRQKELEQELRLTNTRFRTVLRGSPIVVFNQDRELRYTWINNADHYYRGAEVIGQRDIDMIERREDGERLEAIKRRVLESGRGTRESVELSVRGELQRYDMYVEPLRDEADEIIGITGVAVNQNS